MISHQWQDVQSQPFSAPQLLTVALPCAERNSSSSSLRSKRPKSPYQQFCQVERPLLPTTLRNAARETLLVQRWKALSEAERRQYKTLNSEPWKALPEAERLQYKRPKCASSGPILGSPTATTVILASQLPLPPPPPGPPPASVRAGAYDALLLAQIFDHAGSHRVGSLVSRFMSKFLDTAMVNMTEEETVEVMLGVDPSADRSQPRLCLDDQQQQGG